MYLCIAQFIEALLNMKYLLILAAVVLSKYSAIGQPCGIPASDIVNCVIWDKFNVKTIQGEILRFTSTCGYKVIGFERNDGNSVNVKLQDHVIYITSGNDKYELKLNARKAPILQSAKKTYTPPKLIDNTISISQPGRLVTVKLNDLGVQIMWDTRDFVEVVIDNKEHYDFTGICSKDCAADQDTFVKEYAIPDGCTAQNPTICPPANKRKASFACTKLFKERVYLKCQNTVYAQPFIDACISLHCNCQLPDKNDCLCDLISAYFKTCHRQTGEALEGWRTPKFCHKDCPGTTDLEYFDCGPVNGGLTCGSEPQDNVDQDNECVEGCFCPIGLLLHNGKCYLREECPCQNQKTIIKPGGTIQMDCNTCTCRNGHIECPDITCYDEGGAVGDPHYTTFDGKRYDFMGKCTYYLVKGKDFSVEADHYVWEGNKFVKNHQSNAPSYTKVVYVNVLRDSITLSPNCAVTVNGQRINDFPHQVSGITISKPTASQVVVELKNKVQVIWDGSTGVRVRVPTNLRGRVKGLLGNDNKDPNDDFMLPNGKLVFDANTFGNAWKVDSSCEDKEFPLEHPCVRNPLQREIAEEACLPLKSNVFKQCKEFNVRTSYDECVYDCCDNVKLGLKCACPNLLTFAKSCAAKGRIIDWIEEAPECKIECPKGQIYSTCHNPCESSCNYIAVQPNCQKFCVEGCSCPVGQSLDENDKCTPIEKCKCKMVGKYFDAGFQYKTGTNQLHTCIRAKWVTKKITNQQARNIPTKEDLEAKCNKDKGLEFTTCKNPQPKTCKNMDKYIKHGIDKCQQGCECRNDLVLDDETKMCTKPEDCPCMFNGRSYNNLEERWEINKKCVCRGRRWECSTNNARSNKCTIIDNYHIRGFNGKLISFQSDCGIILADGSNGKRSFSIAIETDNIYFHYNKNEHIVIPRSKGLNYEGASVKFLDLTTSKIYEEVDLGVKIIWHRDGWIQLHIDSIWENIIDGICGQLPAENDANIQPLDAESLDSSVSPYASDPDCSEFKLFTKATTFDIDDAPIPTKCDLLKDKEFDNCAIRLPSNNYYETCLLGVQGFAEKETSTEEADRFYCGVLASFAEECTDVGLPVNWRKNDFCTPQCEPNQQYSKCISVCTCADVEKGGYENCTAKSCVEGCVSEVCAAGSVYMDTKFTKCVTLATCADIKCKKDLEGRPSYCKCDSGNVICETTTTTTTTETPATTTKQSTTTTKPTITTQRTTTTKPSITTQRTTTTKPTITTQRTTTATKPAITTHSTTAATKPAITTQSTTTTTKPAITTQSTTAATKQAITTQSTTTTTKPAITTQSVLPPEAQNPKQNELKKSFDEVRNILSCWKTPMLCADSSIASVYEGLSPKDKQMADSFIKESDITVNEIKCYTNLKSIRHCTCIDEKETCNFDGKTNYEMQNNMEIKNHIELIDFPRLHLQCLLDLKDDVQQCTCLSGKKVCPQSQEVDAPIVEANDRTRSISPTTIEAEKKIVVYYFYINYIGEQKKCLKAVKNMRPLICTCEKGHPKCQISIDEQKILINERDNQAKLTIYVKYAEYLRKQLLCYVNLNSINKGVCWCEHGDEICLENPDVPQFVTNVMVKRYMHTPIKTNQVFASFETDITCLEGLVEQSDDHCSCEGGKKVCKQHRPGITTPARAVPTSKPVDPRKHENNLRTTFYNVKRICDCWNSSNNCETNQINVQHLYNVVTPKDKTLIGLYCIHIDYDNKEVDCLTNLRDKSKCKCQDGVEKCSDSPTTNHKLKNDEDITKLSKLIKLISDHVHCLESLGRQSQCRCLNGVRVCLNPNIDVRFRAPSRVHYPTAIKNEQDVVDHLYYLRNVELQLSCLSQISSFASLVCSCENSMPRCELNSGPKKQEEIRQRNAQNVKDLSKYRESIKQQLECLANLGFNSGLCRCDKGKQICVNYDAEGNNFEDIEHYVATPIDDRKLSGIADKQVKCLKSLNNDLCTCNNGEISCKSVAATVPIPIKNKVNDVKPFNIIISPVQHKLQEILSSTKGGRTASVNITLEDKKILQDYSFLLRHAARESPHLGENSQQFLIYSNFANYIKAQIACLETLSHDHCYCSNRRICDRQVKSQKVVRLIDIDVRQFNDQRYMEAQLRCFHNMRDKSGICKCTNGKEDCGKPADDILQADDHVFVTNTLDLEEFVNVQRDCVDKLNRGCICVNGIHICGSFAEKYIVIGRAGVSEYHESRDQIDLYYTAQISCLVKLDRTGHIACVNGNLIKKRDTVSSSKVCPANTKLVKKCRQCNPICQPQYCVTHILDTEYRNTSLIKQPEEQWSEGLCRHCTCKSDSVIGYYVHCSEQRCTIPRSEQIEYEEVYVEGACCPTPRPIGCKHEGKVYQLNSRNKIDEESCDTLICSINGKGKVSMQLQKTICDKKCPEGYEYHEKPKSCCGECVQVGCIVDKTTRAKGDSWYAEDGCLNTCLHDGEKFIILKEYKHCPPVENCEGLIKRRNCCDYCETTPIPDSS